MDKQEAAQHIEMFVRNKIREGYRGLFPKRTARKNVARNWNKYKNIGANQEAILALGGEDEAVRLMSDTFDRILDSEHELQVTLKGQYSGSHEDLLKAIWED